jgi:hypothetical protein
MAPILSKTASLTVKRTFTSVALVMRREISKEIVDLRTIVLLSAMVAQVLFNRTSVSASAII